MAEHLIEIEAAKTDLLACATYIAENIKSADGHAEAMKEIVPRYLEKGAVDLAAELANTVDDPFTRDRLLLRVAEKCAAVGDDEYAFQLVEAIEETSTQDEARERIAGQKAESGDFAKAFEIAETLPHPYLALVEISGHLAANDGAKALETIEKIDFPNAKRTALQNLATVNLEKGDEAEAIRILDSATESIAEIEFVEEKINAFLEIGGYYLDANRNDKAVEVFDRAKAAVETLDNVQRDSFLANVALGFLLAGSLELADRTLDLVGDNVQISSALLGFAREFRRRGETSDALETLEESYSILKSQRSGEVRDSKARFGLWAEIATEYAWFEKPERAIEIAQEITEENFYNAALNQIAQVCVIQNKDDLARQAVNAIFGDNQKMLALIAVSDVKNESGDTGKAVKFLTEAETLAETVEQLSLCSDAFSELTRRFHSLGSTDKARELVIKNLDTIFNIRDESSRAVSLAQMADFYHSSDLELTIPEREMLLRIIGKSNG